MVSGVSIHGVVSMTKKLLHVGEGGKKWANEPKTSYPGRK